MKNHLTTKTIEEISNKVIEYLNADDNKNYVIKVRNKYTYKINILKNKQIYGKIKILTIEEEKLLKNKKIFELYHTIESKMGLFTSDIERYNSLAHAKEKNDFKIYDKNAITEKELSDILDK